MSYFFVDDKVSLFYFGIPSNIRALLFRGTSNLLTPGTPRQGVIGPLLINFVIMIAVVLGQSSAAFICRLSRRGRACFNH